MTDPATVPHVRVAIVGAGFAGIGTAIRLKQDGVRDFVVLERADDVGGTWRDNTYPGCACDVPSHLYSFSFAPNPEWGRTYSPQPEIWDYLRRCAKDRGVMEHVRLGHELLRADWDEQRGLWSIETGAGRLTANVLVSGVGALSEPKVPSIPGLDRFRGTMFHSARWDHTHDLSGERVAVVGTGASAIQLVPQVQPRVARLRLFQRTPAWVLPHTSRPLTAFEHRVYRQFPALQRLSRAAIYWARETMVLGFTVDPRLMKLVERLARRHLREQVSDPELRAKLTPDYRLGCKRILPSNDYYPALTKPNVAVVTEGIREVRPHAVVTRDGVEHPVDTIIFGTGFHVTDMPVAQRIRGSGGLLLEDAWRDAGQQAYKGTTIAGFPNLFMLVGPNTGLGHSSMVLIIESQLRYVMGCLRYMDEHGVRVVDVRPEAQAGFNVRLRRRMRRTVWVVGGCVSWYLDIKGRNTTLWPASTWRFRRLTRRFDPARYVTE